MNLDEADFSIGANDVARIMRYFQLRCQAALSGGGISETRRVDGKAGIPEDWVLDADTMYWLPPNIKIGLRA